jgi:outer membrane protein insertion porin family
VSYDFERSKARDVDITDPAALAALDDVDISAVEVLARYDTRDSPILPSDGNTARASLQWGDQVLGSELDFLRARYNEAHFWRLRKTTVLALSLRTGGIVPTHDTTEIPLQERFFNGGESTVRSFEQDELGPLDAGGEPLGGEAFTTLSGEVREQLFGNLAGAVFADMGNVVPNYEDYFAFADFRSGFGVGIRYMLPIGPLRLDFAWNPHPKGDEDGLVVHFSVGMPF